MASTAEKLDLELWEEAKADARDAYGGHSARAMQYASKLYKARGGRYKGRKRADNRLVQWTRQDWTTKSGRPSRETGERYLPRAAIESLSSAEYGATSRAKRRGGGVGSVVAQPQSIREKTRKFRKVNPDMATAKQIAARKKFAERARSGELAKMRKKNPAKKPTRAASRKANPDGKKFVVGKYYETRLITDSNSKVGALILGRTEKSVTVQGTDNLMKTKYKLTNDYQGNEMFFPYGRYSMAPQIGADDERKSNPTATRAPARKRTQLIQNGERKKNPATKDVFFVNVIDEGGFQFGMDDRTPVLFKFSNREMKRGVYRSFALPFNVTSNPQFQDFVKSLPGNQIVISLKDLRKQLSAYA